MVEKLIGAQILSIEEETIKVKLGDSIHTLKIISDDGDCCGSADFSAKLLYEENNIRNPIITNVELKNTSDEGDADSSVFTFYGEAKALAQIHSNASSGSGWNYGACVTLTCKTLNIHETLAEW